MTTALSALDTAPAAGDLVRIEPGGPVYTLARLDGREAALVPAGRRHPNSAVSGRRALTEDLIFVAADQPDGAAVRRERADLVALTTAGTGVERELFLYLADYRTRERRHTSAAVYSLTKRAQAELAQSPLGHALTHATLLEALARFDDEHPIPAYTAEPASNPRFDCIQWQPSGALTGAISNVLLFLASEHGRAFGYAGGAGAAMDFGTEHGATISVLPWQWIARHHDGTITLHDSNPLSPTA